MLRVIATAFTMQFHGQLLELPLASSSVRLLLQINYCGHESGQQMSNHNCETGKNEEPIHMHMPIHTGHGNRAPNYSPL